MVLVRLSSSPISSVAVVFTFISAGILESYLSVSSEQISSEVVSFFLGAATRCLFLVQLGRHFPNCVGNILVMAQAFQVIDHERLDQGQRNVQRTFGVVHQVTHHGIKLQKAPLPSDLAKHVLLQVLGRGKGLHLRIGQFGRSQYRVLHHTRGIADQEGPLFPASGECCPDALRHIHPGNSLQHRKLFLLRGIQLIHAVGDRARHCGRGHGSFISSSLRRRNFLFLLDRRHLLGQGNLFHRKLKRLAFRGGDLCRMLLLERLVRYLSFRSRFCLARRIFQCRFWRGLCCFISCTALAQLLRLRRRQILIRQQRLHYAQSRTRTRAGQ